MSVEQSVCVCVCVSIQLRRLRALTKAPICSTIEQKYQSPFNWNTIATSRLRNNIKRRPLFFTSSIPLVPGRHSGVWLVWWRPPVFIAHLCLLKSFQMDSASVSYWSSRITRPPDGTLDFPSFTLYSVYSYDVSHLDYGSI